MKQTILPTHWEKIWHLYIRGMLITLGFFTIITILGMVFMTLALQFTTFEEELVPKIMPFFVFGCWIGGTAVGYLLQKRHLLHSQYHFSNKKVKIVSLRSQVYATVFYFVIIALF